MQVFSRLFAVGLASVALVGCMEKAAAPTTTAPPEAQTPVVTDSTKTGSALSLIAEGDQLMRRGESFAAAQRYHDATQQTSATVAPEAWWTARIQKSIALIRTVALNNKPESDRKNLEELETVVKTIDAARFPTPAAFAPLELATGRLLVASYGQDAAAIKAAIDGLESAAAAFRKTPFSERSQQATIDNAGGRYRLALVSRTEKDFMQAEMFYKLIFADVSPYPDHQKIQIKRIYVSAMTSLAQASGQERFIEEAIAANRAILAMTTPQTYAYYWGTAQVSLGGGLSVLAERRKNRALAHDAVQAYFSAIAPLKAVQRLELAEFAAQQQTRAEQLEQSLPHPAK